MAKQIIVLKTCRPAGRGRRGAARAGPDSKEGPPAPALLLLVLIFWNSAALRGQNS
jgi:hypothetical protein